MAPAGDPVERTDDRAAHDVADPEGIEDPRTTSSRSIQREATRSACSRVSAFG